jgi:hypothetical protein
MITPRFRFVPGTFWWLVSDGPFDSSMKKLEQVRAFVEWLEREQGGR